MESPDKNLSSDEELVDELKGKTLLIYWYMIRTNKPLGAREIQRNTGLSSSSLALHHLNKLIELGLVKTNKYGQYIVARRVAPGLLSLYIGTGRLFAPRFVLYALFFTSMFISTILIFFTRLDSASILLLIVSLFASIIFWHETYKMWKVQPL
ncbi:MAG: transcriptional regulator [Candidatus Thorarchaeota archaeon]|nr:MAG: transcriptional regulator [Candidatus Thorarchaeota archaeon]